MKVVSSAGSRLAGSLPTPDDDRMGLTDKSRLQVESLCVDFRVDQRWVRAVDQVEFCLRAGRTLALVGESGSGKSVTSLAVMGLLPHAAGRAEGQVCLEGRNLLSGSERDWRAVRGRRRR